MVEKSELRIQSKKSSNGSKGISLTESSINLDNMVSFNNNYSCLNNLSKMRSHNDISKIKTQKDNQIDINQFEIIKTRKKCNGVKFTYEITTSLLKDIKLHSKLLLPASFSENNFFKKIILNHSYNSINDFRKNDFTQYNNLVSVVGLDQKSNEITCFAVLDFKNQYGCENKITNISDISQINDSNYEAKSSDKLNTHLTK